MAERIGRVDFLVSLDGRRLPQEARRLGREIGEAGGDEAGKSFNDRFSGSVDAGLTRVGRNFSRRLGQEGRLAGERFGDTFSTEVQGKFRRMQNDIARILGDRSAFEGWAKNFGESSKDVDRAVNDLIGNLGRLRDEQVELVDANGELYRSQVLTEKEFGVFARQARELGNELQKTRIEQEKSAEETARLGREQERLTAQTNRFLRLISDGDAFRGLAERVGGTSEAYERMRSQLQGLHDEQQISIDQLYRYSDALDVTKRRVDATIETDRRKAAQMLQLAQNTARVADSSDRAGGSFERLGKRLASSHGFRQAAFWTGLIASSAEHIAVLGSAAGAGIIALGGALSQFVVGGGAAVAMFTRLNKDLEELPPNLRNVASQFQEFKRELTTLADTISEGAFSEMDGTFDRLGETVRGLSPAFRTLGTVIGRVMDDFSRAVRPGTEMFEQLNILVENSASGFDTMARSAGTLGGALLRSFNRAQPLIEMMYGWIDKLVTRFDDFSKSNGFDEWMNNAQRVFSALGPLLDAAGRALNDLVTPDTVARTEKFLNNLTDFMPDLARLLNMIGGLDAFGLAAQLLADFGEALRPLAEPMTKLAVQINRIASTLIGSFAEALGTIARLLAPLVDGLADVVSAIPAPVMDGIAASIVSLAGAFVLLKGASGILGVVDALGAFGGAAGLASGKAAGLANSLKGFAGKAGLIGAATVGLLALGQAAVELARDMAGVDDAVRESLASNQSLVSSYNQLQGVAEGLSPKLTDVGAALDALVGIDVGNSFSVFGGSMSEAGKQAVALGSTLRELDGGMKGLPLEEQAARFVTWTQELGASREQSIGMLNAMTNLKQGLIDAAAANGQMLTDQQLVTEAFRIGAGAADGQAGALGSLGSQADDTRGRIDLLSEQINNFGKAELDARAASREFEAATADLTAKLAENGSTLDRSTAEGRENEAAIDDLIRKTLSYSDATLQNTGSQEAANAVITDGRTRLQAMLEQFGITGAAADQYTGLLQEIPGDVDTDVQNTAPDARARAGEYIDRLNQIPPDKWTQINSNASDADWQVRALQEALNAIEGIYDVVVNTTYNTRGGGMSFAPMSASGGLFNGATVRTLGEAGPEMIVPVRRPLSQVDPAVREVSAFAQGLYNPKTKDDSSGSGRVVNIEPGAIVIQGATDPYAAASAVLDGIARELG